MRRAFPSARWLTLSGSLLHFAACGGEPPEAPRILAYVPDRLVEGSGGSITLETEGVPPLVVDYGASRVEVPERVELFLGDLALEGERRPEDPDHVVVAIPSALPIGDYPLRLRFEDGRQTRAAGSFRVSPSPVPIGYTFDPIAAQERGVPFEITLRAQGSAAADFDGTVQLSASKGSISPSVTGPFENGVRVETVTVTPVADELTITASDDAGHSGTSNAFSTRD